MNDRKSFYFNPGGRGLEVFLGPTEARLMELCWQHKQLTVKKAIFHLGTKRSHAYTTIMTVLGNLANKGLLKKVKKGRLFCYSPAVDKNKFIKDRVQTVERCLRSNFDNI